MKHRDHNVQGIQACQKCGREIASEKCIEDHDKRCKATKLEDCMSPLLNMPLIGFVITTIVASQILNTMRC